MKTTLKELRQIIKEKVRRIVMEEKTLTVNNIVKILQSPDFDFTKSRGKQAIAKNNYLIIKDTFYYRGDSNLNEMIKDWTDPKGSYYSYFKDEYGIGFKLIDSDSKFTGGTIWGKVSKTGVNTIKLSIIK